MRRTKIRAMSPAGKMCISLFTPVMVVVVLTSLLTMLAAPPFHGSLIDLPRVGHPTIMQGAGRRSALLLSVLRDGMIYFGNDHSSADRLPSKIRQRLHRGQKAKFISGPMLTLGVGV
jgi:biopolymer transport protein ExbD